MTPANGLLQLLEPLPGSVPAGVDLYAAGDDDYALLESEIGKLSRPAGTAVQWGEIVGTATRVLREKSKDYRVATWLTLALTHERGYAGLAEGLDVLLGLVRGFWIDGHPGGKSLRGRDKAVSWLADRITGYVKKHLTSVPELVRPCVRRLFGIKVGLRRRLIDGGAAESVPKLHTLAKLLVDGLAAGRQQSPLTSAGSVSSHLNPIRPADSAPAVTKPALAKPDPPPVNGMETADAAKAALRGLKQTVGHMADLLLANNPRDPLPFRLARFAAWLELGAPECRPDGCTVVPGQTPEDGKASLESAAASPLESIQHFEKLGRKNPFWLDPHHRQWVNLGSLGIEYARARDAVLSELAALLIRLPDLPSMKFASGMSFANDETRAWIDGEVRGSQRGGLAMPIVTPALPEGDADAFAEAEKVAGDQAVGGDIVGALRLLHVGADRVSQRRDRFRLRLRVARFCLQHSLPKVGLGQLEGLLREVEYYRLEEWEPALAVDVLALLVVTYRALGRASDSEVQLYLRRLYCLDPGMALAIDGSAEKP